MGHADTHKRMHQLFNDRDFDSMPEHLGPSFMFEDLAQRLTAKTPEEFVDYLRGWVAAFSDGRVDSPAYLEGADFSVCLFHARGTNDGAFGPFPATGRTVDQAFIEILHFDPDGRVATGQMIYDQMGMLRQLGHVPDPTVSGEGGADLETVVRDLYDAADNLDLDRAMAMVASDAEGIDELSGRWLRGRDQVEAHFRGLQSELSDVRTELSDVAQRVWGDVGIVTMWVRQEYTVNGEHQRVSAPTTLALRREGGDWKVAVYHSIPVPEEV